MTLTPAGELAAATITSCAVCRGRVWCPSCEDRRDVLATAIEAIVACHVAAALTEVADRIEPGRSGGPIDLPSHWSTIERLSFQSGMDHAARIVRGAIPPP